MKILFIISIMFLFLINSSCKKTTIPIIIKQNNTIQNSISKTLDSLEIHGYIKY